MFPNRDLDTVPPGSIVLETHESSKVLQLLPAPPSPYNSDLHFDLRTRSSTISTLTGFQVSEHGVRAFLNDVDGPSMLLQDENGHGSITFEKIDRIGHFRVNIEVGGPWSDQAKITFETDQTAVTKFVADLRRSQSVVDLQDVRAPQKRAAP